MQIEDSHKKMRPFKIDQSQNGMDSYNSRLRYFF